MKVKNTYVDFTDVVDVGRYAFFIEADEYGTFVDEKELVKQAQHFPRVLIKGFRVFGQKKEIASLIKKLVKINPDVVFDIHSDGTIKPAGIDEYTNVVYNVHLQLKNSEIDFDDRIKSNVIEWFNQAKANFVFKVRNEDDIDEVNLLVKEHSIKKHQVFLSPKEDVTDLFETMTLIIKNAKYNGYNFSATVETKVVKGR